MMEDSVFDQLETRARCATLSSSYEVEGWLNGVLQEVIVLDNGTLEAISIKRLSVVALDLSHIIVTAIVEYEWFDQEIYSDEEEIANEEPIPVDLGATICA